METTRHGDRLDLLDAVIYGDAFDCAVTLDEIWRYARIAVGRDDLRRRIEMDPILSGVVTHRDGLYCLAGRVPLLAERPGRMARARRLQRRARWIARILRHLPFVRGLTLTGSVSADDAAGGADIDLLVIVAAGRLGTAFLLLAPLARIFGGRLFCPNWYLSEDRLDSVSRNLYVARELAQSMCLWGDADALLGANPWIRAVFPNATGPRPMPRESSWAGLQRGLEALLSGAVGRAVEGWPQGVARRRLGAHYGRFALPVPAAVAEGFEAESVLGFHGYRYEARILEAHATGRTRLDIALADGSQP